MDPELDGVPELRGSEEGHLWRPGGSNQRKEGDCSSVHLSVICGCARLDGTCVLSSLTGTGHLRLSKRPCLSPEKIKPSTEVAQCYLC